MKKYSIKTLADLEVFAVEFAKTLQGGEIVGLVGELGAGKTTFTQKLAAALGVKKPVRSPTFILMQIIDLPAARRPLRRICHIDAYRLKETRELLAVGFDEYAGAWDTVTLVEWADRVPEIAARPGYQELRFTYAPEGGREIVWEAVGK